MREYIRFIRSLDSKPLVLGLAVCALFCFPRIVLTGPHTYTQPEILLRVPAEGLSAEHIQDAVKPPVLEELRDAVPYAELAPKVMHSQLLIAAKLPFRVQEDAGMSCMRRAVNRIRDQLPYQVGSPTIESLSDPPAFLKMYCRPAQQHTPSYRRSVSDTDDDLVPESDQNLSLVQIKEQLHSIPDINSIVINGFTDREIIIRLKPSELVVSHLSPLYIQNYLQKVFFRFHAGIRAEKRKNIGIFVKSDIKTFSDIADLSIPFPDNLYHGGSIRLSDIAHIKETKLPPAYRVISAGNNELHLRTDNSHLTPTEPAFPHINNTQGSNGKTNNGNPGSTPGSLLGRNTGRNTGRNIGEVLGDEAIIAVHTPSGFHIAQQFMLFIRILKVLRNSDAVHTFNVFGGCFISTIRQSIALIALWIAGALGALYVKTHLRFLSGGIVLRYISTSSVFILCHSLLQIPISPYRLFLLPSAVFGSLFLYEALVYFGNNKLWPMILRFLIFSFGILTVVITLKRVEGLLLHTALHVCTDFGNHTCSFSGPQTPPVYIIFHEVLEESCVVLISILLSGIKTIIDDTSWYSVSPIHTSPISSFRFLFISILLFLIACIPWGVLPHATSFQITPTHPGTNLQLLLVRRFHSVFPQNICVTSSFHCRRVRYCRSANEYWNMYTQPHHIQGAALLSSFTALQSIVEQVEHQKIKSLPYDNNPPSQSTHTGHVIGLKIDTGYGLDQLIRQKNLFAQLRLAVDGIPVGTVKETHKFPVVSHVRLYYGDNLSLQDLSTLPVFLKDGKTIQLDQLCSISPVNRREDQ